MRVPGRPASPIGAVIAFLIAAVFVAAQPPSVSGHAILIRTDPGDGVVLTQTPDEIRLWFSEAVLPAASSFELMDSKGHGVRLNEVRTATNDPAELIVRLPRLSTSTFRLAWKTVSAGDLHVTAGSLVFGIGQLSRAVGADAGGPEPIEIVLGWLGLTALAGLIGALVVGLLVSDETPRRTAPTTAAVLRSRRRLRALALASAIGGAGVGVATFLVKASSFDTRGLGVAVPILLQSSSGALLLTTALILGMSAVLVALLTRGNEATAAYGTARSRRRLITGAFGIALLVLVLATIRVLGSHSAGAPDRSGFALVAGVVHLASVIVWVGGLMALVVGVTPLVRSGRDERQRAVATLRRFGWIAGPCVALTVISGLALAGRLVPSVGALFDAPYGQLLLVKLVVVCVVATLGLLNAVSVRSFAALNVASVATASPLSGPVPTPRPALRSRLLTRRIAAEAGGALLVVGVAASLATTPPAVDRGVARPTEPVATRMTSGSADDLVVTIAISPNRPGPNFVTVGLYNTLRPAPGVINEVVATVRETDGASDVAETRLTSIGEGRYAAPLDLTSAARPLQLSVTARRSGLRDASLSAAWSVQPASADLEPALISDGQLRPALDRMAALVAIASVAVLAVAIGHGRRRARNVARGTGLQVQHVGLGHGSWESPQ